MSRVRPTAIHVPPRAIAAVLLSLLLASFLHAWLRLLLQNRGVGAESAYYLTYFIVPLALTPTLFVILRQQQRFALSLLDVKQLGIGVVFAAIALGVLLRIVYWAQLVARVSFGIGNNAAPDAAIGPSFTFGCPELAVMLPGIFTMVLLVPFTEELVTRGVLQSAFARRGPVVAIALSSTTFALLHKPPGFLFVLFTGVVLGALFWQTRLLWPPIIAHATYNGLIQFDWRCMTTVWRPAADTLPLFVHGITAASILVVGVLWCLLILSRIGPGRTRRPGRHD